LNREKPEPPGKFAVEPGKPDPKKPQLFNRNRPGIFRFYGSNMVLYGILYGPYTLVQDQYVRDFFIQSKSKKHKIPAYNIQVVVKIFELEIFPNSFAGRGVMHFLVSTY